jgi:hypothetical protein
MTFSEATNEVLRLAKAIRRYHDAELPKRHPEYPFVDPWGEIDPAPPEKHELKSFLERLPSDFVYKLALLMYLGRGDYSTDELTEQYDAIRKTFAKPELAISQMMEKAPLADYLSDGLLELENHGVDADNLLVAATPSVRN